MLESNPKAVAVAPLTHADFLNLSNSILTVWPYSAVPGNPYTSQGGQRQKKTHSLITQSFENTECCPSISPQGHLELALAEPRNMCSGKFIFTSFILADGISLWRKRHGVWIKASAKLTNYIHKIAGEVAIIDMSKFLGDFAEKNAYFSPHHQNVHINLIGNRGKGYSVYNQFRLFLPLGDFK